MPHELDVGTLEGVGASGKDRFNRRPRRSCVRCEQEIAHNGGKKYCDGCSDTVRNEQRKAQKARHRARMRA